MIPPFVPFCATLPKDPMPIFVEFQLRTISEANQREHWARKAKRAAEQRFVAHAKVAHHRPKRMLPLVGAPPIRVTLTRVVCSPGLDDDNLRGALKAVRDGVADALGVNDRDPRVEWHYGQAKAKTRKDFAVRVQIEAGAS